jgi:hypothetical protein
MAYTKYSLTPADNNAAPPNGAPEGMLPSAVNDTMRDMMAQIRDVGDGIRGGTYTMTAPIITGGSITGVALSGNTLTNPVITGGSINNTTVGATTRSTGAFTTLASNGATTFTAGTASTSTTTGTAVITGGLGVSGRINAANFDGIVGANTAAAGNFTTLGATGVATFSAGTVSAPAITTTGDTNTGIYFPAADTIAFTEGGTEAMRITSDGRLGIGTSSPTATLEVLGGGSDGFQPFAVNSTSAELYTTYRYSSSTLLGYIGNGSGTISGTSNLFVMRSQNDLAFAAGGATERMRITSGGQVLIGTTATPSQNYEVLQGVNSGGAGLGLGRTSASTIAADAFLGGIDFLGAGLATSAYIWAYTDAAQGSNDLPSRITFGTAADGSGSVTERMRIDSSGNVGIGVSSVSSGGTRTVLQISNGSSGGVVLLGNAATDTDNARIVGNTLGNGVQDLGLAGGGATGVIASFTNGSERMRIDSSGYLLIGQTTTANWSSGSTAGIEASGFGIFTSVNAALVGGFRRTGDDGNLVQFWQDNAQEGNISVSGSTVSYNGGHLSRWSQWQNQTGKPEVYRGSVLESTNDMCEWNQANEQATKTIVSTTAKSKTVAGVFDMYDTDDKDNPYDFYVAQSGDFVIRIAQGVVVENGDLLESAGDGTARPQTDDICRSSTIAKVTSNYVSTTYADGSYCVPCILMIG